MPGTRSSARLHKTPRQEDQKPVTLPPVTSKATKRKAEDIANPSASKNIKLSSNTVTGTTAFSVTAPVNDTTDDVVPAVLTFDFEAAKQHLILADPRFADLFLKMECKPFQHLEQVHPFRALATSILGQQISWLAARSIKHRFIRLFDPDLPEQPTEEERQAITFFPSPEQVASVDIATLRTAGLSVRKAEYVRDLAARFTDGSLSTSKLLSADDEELTRLLTDVRGIGRWTVDMFAIFSLRRPDILPIGDLGVQKGLLRWILSLHSPEHPFSIAPEKVGGTSASDSNDKPESQLPLPTSANAERAVTPGPVEEEDSLNRLPPVFTPSINRTLTKPLSQGLKPPPLSPGLSVKELKARLDGKKIKGALLTPQEMTEMTESWRPYRSVGVYYMWSLAA